MARQDKPLWRDPWASAVSTAPDIVESVYPDTGFPAPAGIPVVPERGEVNHEFNRYDRGLAYIYQRGIPDWDEDEDGYGEFDVLRDPTDGKFYQLVGTATPGTEPSADGANWYSWLLVPQGLPAETEIHPIAIWKNPNGFPVSGKDRRGFDCGHILDFIENWTDGAAAARGATAAKAHWFGPWSTGADNSGGTPAGIISLQGPYDTDLTTHPWGPYVSVNGYGQSVADVSIVETTKPIIKMSQASLVFECDFSINGASGPQSGTSLSVGLGDGTLAANRSLSAAVNDVMAYGAWIEVFPGQANYLVASKPQGGAVDYDDSGIAVSRDVKHRYRCVIVGASDSDDSTARVFHIMNGVIVANQTTSLTNRLLSPFVRAWGSTGEVCAINVGPIRCQARLAFGNILI